MQLKGDCEDEVAAGEACSLQTVSHWNLLIVLETTLLLQGARLGWDWCLVTASASLMYLLRIIVYNFPPNDALEASQARATFPPSCKRPLGYWRLPVMGE